MHVSRALLSAWIGFLFSGATLSMLLTRESSQVCRASSGSSRKKVRHESKHTFIHKSSKRIALRLTIPTRGSPLAVAVF